MKQKILLIEDNESDFNRVKIFFETYNVDFYPRDYKEFVPLSKNLMKYARVDTDRKSIFFNDITDYIKKVEPSIILLDLGLSGQKESLKQDGFEFLTWIRKNLDPLTEIFIFSRYENNGTIDNTQGYIQKEGVESVEKQLFESIIKKHKIEKENAAIGVLTQENLNKKDEDIKSNSVEHYNLSAYEKTSNILSQIISSWIPLIIDFIITLIFQLAILLLFIFAPIDILVNSTKIDSFKIAERCFIAFLPFLITFGFYIFYKKSLRTYFLRTVSDSRNEDFESASILMKLTKKLFISSLLSYLFIKIIELLFFEKPEIETNYFFNYYKLHDPLIQLYVIAGLIIILITYYLFIDKHHSNNNSNNNQ